MEDKKKENETRFIYEKAIERYNEFEKKYKEWMHLYAIFVGALFVAFCNKEVRCDGFLSILIPIVGIITSFCWLGSFHGHYAWLNSWTKILHLQENNYLSTLTKESGESDAEFEKRKNAKRVYTLVYVDFLKNVGFSTQKITLLFIWIVTLAWVALLISSVNLDIVSNWGWWYWLILGIVLIVPATLCVVIIIKSLWKIISDLFKNNETTGNENREKLSCWNKLLCSNIDYMYWLHKDGSISSSEQEKNN